MMTFETEAVNDLLARVCAKAYDEGRRAALADEMTDEMTACPYHAEFLYQAWQQGYWEEGTVDSRAADAIVAA
jgi:hypothetical protein